MAWGLIVDGKIVEITPENPSGRYNAALVWADLSAASPTPDVGWSGSQTNGVWTFSAPAAAAPSWGFAAQMALDASDITILRCFEHGVAVPAEWVTYRAALRAIVAGTSTPAELPARPAYPAGT